MSTSSTTMTPATAATSTTRWTVDALSEHFTGELAQDRNATGGTVPDRQTRLVREAGQNLWTIEDWRYRWKPGTLTTVADTQTAALPSDFFELAQRWLRDPQVAAYHKIRFFESPELYQALEDQWDSTDSDQYGEPRYAVIHEDTSQSTFTYYVRLAPTPDAVYTYPFWYLTADPFILGTTDDDEYVPWPKPFDDAWYWNAAWRVQRAFRGDDEWKATREVFQDAVKQLRMENDETMVRVMDRIRDTYKDFGSTASSLHPRYTGFLATRWHGL